MNILFLEDRGTVAYNLVQLIESRGHKIYHAANISAAKSYWNDSIDCIILDLNVSPDGLNQFEIDQMECGLYGWIWFKLFVFSQRPEIIKKTIIFSEYIAQFIEHVNKEEYEGIAGIFHKRENDVIKRLLDLLSYLNK